MSKKFAVLLVRVSTETQNYEAQINDLKSYVGEQFGFTDFKVIHTKESGLADLEDKIGANEMFKFLKENKQYKTVIATEMSRLGRRQSVLHAVKEWFYKNQVQLFVKDSQFWLLDDKGEITETAELGFTMYSLFAESEIKRRKDRFMRKRLDLMKQGLSISGKTLFGYKRVPTQGKHTTLVNDEINAGIVLEIYNWYLHGIDSARPNPSIQTIAQHCLKIGYPKYTHSKRNCNKLLKERAYTGFKITNNKRKNPLFGKVEGEDENIVTRNEIKYPVIITDELFNAVQKKLATNTTTKDRYTKHTTILSKLIKCSECGRSLSANYRFYDGANKHSYRCTSRSDAQPCKNKQSISMSLIDSAVWCAIKGDWHALAKLINEYSPKAESIELNEQLQNINTRLTEIESEVDAQEKVLTINSSMKHINLGELVEKTAKRLAKLDKEKGKLDKVKSNIKLRLQMLKNESQDAKRVLDTNLHLIEQDKALIRQYITQFVESIRIPFHNNRYTVIDIRLKYFTKHAFHEYFRSQGLYETVLPDLKPNIVILDKRNTNNIVGYKTTKVLDDDKVDQYVTPEFLKANSLPFFKFEKLNVYNK